MSDMQIKITAYTSLTGSGLLAILIIFLPDAAARAGAVLGLFGCGLLAGMCWQLLICRKIDGSDAANDTGQSK